jgi:hypothetical protein
LKCSECNVQSIAVFDQYGFKAKKASKAKKSAMGIASAGSAEAISGA